MPASLYSQVQGVPGVPALTSAATGNISSLLAGKLSPDVMQEVQDAGATWGVQSGMPGSGAARDVTLQSLGLNSMQAQQTGQQDYMNFLTGAGSLMLDPSLQSEIANRNSIMASAPDPAAAAQQQRNDFSSYLWGMNRGGTGFTDPSGSPITSSGGPAGGFSGGFKNPLTGAMIPSSTWNPFGQNDPVEQWHYGTNLPQDQTQTGGTPGWYIPENPEDYYSSPYGGIDPNTGQYSPTANSPAGGSADGS